jgi:hypothetical protein
VQGTVQSNEQCHFPSQPCKAQFKAMSRLTDALDARHYSLTIFSDCPIILPELEYFLTDKAANPQTGYLPF